MSLVAARGAALSRDARVGAALVVGVALILAEIPISRVPAIVAVLAAQTVLGWELLRRLVVVRASPLGRLGGSFVIGLVAVTIVDQVLVAAEIAWASAPLLAAASVAAAARGHAAVEQQGVGRWRVAGDTMLVPAAAAGLLVDWFWPVPVFVALSLGAGIWRRGGGWSPTVRRLGVVLVVIAGTIGALSWRPRGWQFAQEEQIWGAIVAGSAARIGAFDSIYFAGQPIHYHWFGYAWSGLVARVTGVDEILAVSVVAPLLVAIAALMLGAEIIAIVSGDHRSLLGAVLALAAISTAPIVSRGFTFISADTSKGPASLMLLLAVCVGLWSADRLPPRVLATIAILVFASIGSNTLVGLVTATAAALVVLGGRAIPGDVEPRLVGLAAVGVAASCALWLFLGLPREEPAGNAGIFGRGIGDYLRSAAPETEIFHGLNWAIVIAVSLSGVTLLPVVGTLAMVAMRRVRRRTAVVLIGCLSAGAVGIAFGYTDRFAEQVVLWMGASTLGLPVLIAAVRARGRASDRVARLSAIAASAAVVACGVVVHRVRLSGSNEAVKLRALYPVIPLAVVLLGAIWVLICAVRRKPRARIGAVVTLALTSVGIAYSIVDVVRGVVPSASVVDQRARDWVLTQEERDVAASLVQHSGRRDLVVTNAPESTRVVLMAARAGRRFAAIKPPAVQLPVMESDGFVSALAMQRTWSMDGRRVACEMGARILLWDLSRAALDSYAVCGEIVFQNDSYVLVDLQRRGLGGGVD